MLATHNKEEFKTSKKKLFVIKINLRLLATKEH
jgi:hypothetical protein